MNTLKQWGPEHPLHHEAQRLIDIWSAQILVIARHKMQQSDLKGALDAISYIPKTSPVYAEAQEYVALWQKWWGQGEAIVAKAQAAMKQQKWKEATEAIAELDDFGLDYWRIDRANALSQQLGVERQARQILLAAQKTATNPGQLAVAIAQAQKVPTKTFASEDAIVNITQWSQTLLTRGTQRWMKGDKVGAIATLNLPPNLAATAEVKDLIYFSDAYRLAKDGIDSQWVPDVGQILNLMEAIAAIGQVKPDSPFHKVAQESLNAWQGRLQDLVQLRYASFAAEMGQQPALKLAIGQANQIAANRPGRQQAQTLAAHWNLTAQQIEDQPYLVRARNLARSGQVPDLKRAMQEASQVQLGRPLRQQAQTYIAEWRTQIQVIEDRPILVQARALADNGDLDGAIKTASQIQSGRALYGEAQSVIEDWRYEQIRLAQIAQDRPILDRAYGLAAQGNLNAAIDVAYGIAPGRALYGEAQSAIADWQEQLKPPEPVVPSPAPEDPAEESYSPLEPIYEGPPLEEGSADESDEDVPAEDPLIESEETPLPPLETPSEPVEPLAPVDELPPLHSPEPPLPEEDASSEEDSPANDSFDGYYGGNGRRNSRYER
jgi:hypothetical protein